MKIVPFTSENTEPQTWEVACPTLSRYSREGWGYELRWSGEYELRVGVTNSGRVADLNSGGVGDWTQALGFQNQGSGPLDWTFFHRDEKAFVNRETNVWRHGALQWGNLGAVRAFDVVSVWILEEPKGKAGEGNYESHGQALFPFSLPSRNEDDGNSDDLLVYIFVL